MRPLSAGARAALYGKAASEALLEALWPTRCIVCDVPGELVCDACRAALPYIDFWNRCPKCGGPYGRVQCTECNPLSLKDIGRDGFPFSTCASAVLLDDAARALVSAYKDQGERRCAQVLASMMAPLAPPGRPADAAVTFVPATRSALRRRGFDHAELLASALADALGARLLPLFERPRRKDQRTLTRPERLGNMARGLRLLGEGAGARLPPSLVLVDDVFTTGATLTAASAALRDAGVGRISCITFARVW